MANGTIENTNMNINPTIQPTEDFHQQEGFLYIALKHRWVILCMTILFLAGAFLHLLKATPIYTSTSRLYVEQGGPKIISDFEGFMTRSQNYLYTQAELIRLSLIHISEPTRQK